MEHDFLTISRRDNYYFYSTKRCEDNRQHRWNIYCAEKANLFEKIVEYNKNLSGAGREWMSAHNSCFNFLYKRIVNISRHAGSDMSARRSVWASDAHSLQWVIRDVMPSNCRLRDISLISVVDHATQEMIYMILMINHAVLMRVALLHFNHVDKVLSYETAERCADIGLMLRDLNVIEPFASVVAQYIDWA
jgi:hypothetical protein